ncbi:hypothetical protein RJ639_014247 [Escallonia herrerae]|uniref:Uncharacterized protein n=1 Tax=Escallonia herrerae TaxID=1293975 RepID=A0AA88VL69_9ASTE|nr:hypothetical protein RJ639_014247 [Escallonia herrerae]
MNSSALASIISSPALSSNSLSVSSSSSSLSSSCLSSSWRLFAEAYWLIVPAEEVDGAGEADGSTSSNCSMFTITEGGGMAAGVWVGGGDGDGLSWRCKGRIDPNIFFQFPLEATSSWTLFDFSPGFWRSMNNAAFRRLNAPRFFFFCPLMVDFSVVGKIVSATTLLVTTSVRRLADPVDEAEESLLIDDSCMQLRNHELQLPNTLQTYAAQMVSASQVVYETPAIGSIATAATYGRASPNFQHKSGTSAAFSAQLPLALNSIKLQIIKGRSP